MKPFAIAIILLLVAIGITVQRINNQRLETRHLLERHRDTDSLYAKSLEELNRDGLLLLEAKTIRGNLFAKLLLLEHSGNRGKGRSFVEGILHEYADLPTFLAKLSEKGYRPLTGEELDLLIADNTLVQDEWRYLWEGDRADRNRRGPTIYAFGNALLHYTGEYHVPAYLYGQGAGNDLEFKLRKDMEKVGAREGRLYVSTSGYSFLAVTKK